jgi:hypothetical protein
VRKLLVTLVVLAVLLAAADFGLRAYAESRTASAVQTELKLATAPDVSIEGFPFLLHAFRGQYPEVIISADAIDEGRLPGTRAVVDLVEVTLPPADALAGDTTLLRAQSAALQVLVPLTSLAAALGNPTVTLGPAPDGSLMVSGTVAVLGQSIPVTGTASVSVADSALTLSVGSLTAAGVDLTAVVSGAVQALAGDLTTTIPLPGLPFSVTNADISVTSSDVVVTASTGPVLLSDLR